MNDERFIANKRIPGLDFSKTVGRDKVDYIAPLPNPNKDKLDELITKIKAKHDKIKLRDTQRTAFKAKRMNYGRFYRSKSPSMNDGMSLKAKINKSIQKAKNLKNKKIKKPMNMVTLIKTTLLSGKGYLNVVKKPKSRYQNSTPLENSYKSLVNKIVGSMQFEFDNFQTTG
mmetsp:Transcript_5448/g.4620  ORF Transcript_5448/g.4620 Transcript_5448/m.4620 type:complete len:171 (+) Transcript_5448:959-1471(+)